MLELEIAISIYMDMLDNKIEDLEYFKNKLSPQDFKEFKEAIIVLKNYRSIKSTIEFEEIFKKLDDYKEKLYALPKVANFKKETTADTQKAKDALDKLFDEEFSNE